MTAIAGPGAPLAVHEQPATFDEVYAAHYAGQGPDPDRVALFAALAKLPATQRRAVVLRYLADMTIAEIADRKSVPEGTVRSRLHRVPADGGTTIWVHYEAEDTAAAQYAWTAIN